MTPKEQREARLAAQLRTNLRKRKAQGQPTTEQAGKGQAPRAGDQSG